MVGRERLCGLQANLSNARATVYRPLASDF